MSPATSGTHREVTELNKRSDSDITQFVFAADLGGTHLRSAIIDQAGLIRHQIKTATPQAEKPEEIVRALVTAARECEDRATQLSGRIIAVSVAVPGTVDVATGGVVTAPNLPCLNGYLLAAALESELGCPTLLENDANAAAVGEMWQGAAKGYDAIVCITLGTGVGGGIILNGELWRGADGSAAEIGHMAVNPFDTVPCACGSHGCLEVYSSATAIVRLAREALPRYSGSVLHRNNDLTAETIFLAGKRGDELAIEVFRQMGVYLGIGIASLINLLNPEIIVVGGGVANGWSLFAPHMQEQVIERAFPLPARSVKIVKAECGDAAGLLGAARQAFKLDLSEHR